MRKRGREGGPALMYGAENTISVSTVFRYAPLRMINAGFQSSPGSTICGDAKEGRKEVKGEETDSEHEGKVHAKLVLGRSFFSKG